LYIHALAKSATAEGIELSSLSGIVRNLTAELHLPFRHNQIYNKLRVTFHNGLSHTLSSIQGSIHTAPSTGTCHYAF